jgi:malonate-semialdehyde dehydrogenase (acetylating) / methylmalonate-semialdehyde dehydrogenase
VTDASVTEVLETKSERARGLGRVNHWIGGRVVAGESGRSGPVYNPATGEQTAEVDFASVEEVGLAVAAAKEAFPAWRAVSLSRRQELFFRIQQLVRDRMDDLARILTAEHGKVLTDARGEVQRGLEVIEYACGIPTLLKGAFSEQASTGIDVYSIRQPLGVAAGITPFNFPAMVPMWMWAPALACGNTFVLKPSEKDPSASLLVAELLKEAGVPDGVFNVVHGDKVAVDAVLEHPDIAAVSFVGSTPIARYIYETGTKHGKRVQALGGAKNHMVVLPDADIDMAADAAVSAAYGSAGERCMAVSHVVAVGDAGDALLEAIKERLPKVKVGSGLDPDSEMGPLITREHRDKVASYLDSGPEQGATLVADGRETTPDGDGFFLGVSLLDNVTPEMDAYKDEIFGPVLGITRVDTYDEALRLVNENPYGNGTAIFTRDGGVARQFQFDVQAGMVGINVPIPVPVAYYSFGGWKASLFGDSHIYGPEGINFYTRGKVVTSRWPDPATSKVDLGFPQTR